MRVSVSGQPLSRFGAVFMILFGLVFSGAGVFAMMTIISQGETESGDPVWVGVAFTSIFVLAGLAVFTGGIFTWRKAAANAKLSREHPDEPWLLRKDWAEGRVKDGNVLAMLFFVGFALFWNLISWTVAIGIFLKGEQLEDKGTYFVFMFPFVGAVIALFAIYQFLRWKKYGTSIFELAEVPGVLGGNLGGVVMTKVNIRPEDGFKIVLRSVHKWTTGSGKNRSTHTETLWESEQRMQQEAMPDDPRMSALPILFFIPYRCEPTMRISSSEENYWELEVSAETPGIDYKATFKVPVFRTKDSDINATAPDEDAIPGGATAAPLPTLSSIRGLTIRPNLNGGELLEFKAGRHLWMLLIPAVIGIGLVLGAYFMWTSGEIPKFFAVVFGLFGFLISAGVGSSMLTYVRIIQHDDRLEINSRMFGFGKRRVIPRDTITHIDSKQGMSSGNVVYYNIVIHTSDGEEARIPTLIKGKREADAFIAHLEKRDG